MALLPNVTEHEDTESGGQGNRQNAAENAAQQSCADQHGNNDREGMKAHPVAHDLGRNDEAFEGLDETENSKDQERVQPILELDGGEDHCGNDRQNGAEIRDDAQGAGEDPQNDGVIEAEAEKADSEQDPDTKRDDNLAAKENDEIVVDGIDA